MLLKNKYECCGCTACATVCPTQAISMQPDGMGFKYPRVNNSMCINCGLCERVCSFHPDYKVKSDIPKSQAFLVRHQDDAQVKRSQSGAAFYTLAKHIINNMQGAVYGASFRDDLTVAHSRVVTLEELELLRGSKYVQSDMAGVLCNIKRDLSKGLWVMFCGTPCQVAGVKGYVDDKLKEKLILVDFVCHGVPSPSIWSSNIRYIEKLTKGKVVAANFRDKSIKGWENHQDTYIIQRDGESQYKYIGYKYTRLFYKDIAIRKNCAVCPYANFRRLADITLSDFWGYKRVDASFGADNIGCSMVMCNTQKGLTIFDSIKNEVKLVPANLEDCIQPNLQEPSGEHPQRDAFEKDYVEYGYEYVLRKYGEFDLLSRVRNKIKRILTKPSL